MPSLRNFVDLSLMQLTFQLCLHAPVCGSAMLEVPFWLHCHSGDYQCFLDYYPVLHYEASASWDHFSAPGGIPAIFKRFDWVVGFGAAQTEYGIPDQRRQNPLSVMAHPNVLKPLTHFFSDTMDKSERHRRTLVVGNTEIPLSEWLKLTPNWKQLITLLLKSFGNIFWETKDINVNGIRAMPPALAEYYLCGGVADYAATAIAAAGLSLADKPLKVLAAWGVTYGNFIEKSKPKDSARKTYKWASKSRVGGRAWAQTDAAKEAGVEVRSIDPWTYWLEIAKYRFILSPIGTSITSSKTVESLLVLTIPIVHRGPYSVHDDFLDMGFPIVVIDDWTEITPEKLEEWWQELSPRLKSFRANCLTTDGYWRILNGPANQSCG